MSALARDLTSTLDAFCRLLHAKLETQFKFDDDGHMAIAPLDWDGMQQSDEIERQLARIYALEGDIRRERPQYRHLLEQLVYRIDRTRRLFDDVIKDETGLAPRGQEAFESELRQATNHVLECGEQVTSMLSDPG